MVGVAAAAVVLAIGTPLLGLRAFAATDMLLDHPPWQTAPPGDYQSHNPIFGDTVSTFLPLHAEFRRALYDGDFPLWTPYPGGGHPLGAVPDSGGLGVLGLPYLVVPLWYAPGLSKLLEMAVAIGFTFLFLRRLGLGRPAAVLGGLVFSFTGFQVVWTNWPQSHVGALIPVLFWSVERALHVRPLEGLAPVAGATAAMILEGFPSVTGYTLLAGGIYAVVRVVAERSSLRRGASTLGVMLAGVVLGVALTAAQLLPFAERAQTVNLAYRQQSPDIHIPSRVLATLAIPNAFGSHVDRSYFGPMNYAETQSFVGASSLVLIVAAAAWYRRSIRRGATTYLVVGAALAAGILFVGGPLLRAVQVIPVFGLNFVGRLRSMLGFFLACLAALGFQALADRPALGSRLRAVAVWAVAALLAGYGLVKLWSIGREMDRLEVMVRGSLLALAVAVVAVVAVWVRRRFRPLAVVVLAAFPVLFAIEAVAYAAPYWTDVPRSLFFPVTREHRFFFENLGHDRLLGTSGAMYPGTTTFYRLRSVTTNNTLPPPLPWEELLRTLDAFAFDPSPVFPTLASDRDIATSPILDRMGVRYFVSPTGVEIFGQASEVIRASSTVSLRSGGRLSAEIDDVRRLRGLRVRVMAPVPAGGRDAVIRATLVDGAGEVLATGTRRLYEGSAEGPFTVPVTEPPCPPCEGPIRVVLRSAPGSPPVVLAGADGAGVAVVPVVGGRDGLRVELAERVVAYRRLTALPRIRWAPSATTIKDPSERLRLLAEGVPVDRVILSTDGPAGSGLGAEVTVVRDGRDEIMVEIDAQGSGYLVIADPIQTGWTATIDGREAILRDADHAVAAVLVPPGRHTVSLRFDPSGWRTGLAVSGFALLILLGTAVAAVATRHPAPRTTPSGA
ncbi:MAG TPA: YfhO family protein [Actinomycetota bacterium]|nr:YfhO family protein [Actinomycetota bacterium]